MTQACYFVFSFKKLSPERYFEKNKFIDKSCARKYEKDLKKEFKSWADEKHFEKVKGILPKNSLHEFWKILKTLVQLILNSTWSHVITYTNRISNNITIV